MRKVNISLLILAIFILACNKATFDDSDRVLARVYDDYLYFSDITNLVVPGTSPSDSLNITRNFVNNWVKNQLLLDQAEKNLTEDQKDFSAQLEDYRNSLIIYKYESELIQQNTDTVIINEEIDAYYEKNRRNFKLSENIVQLVFVKINQESSYLDKIKDLVFSANEKDRDSLEYYCIRYAEDFGLIDREWVTFDDMLYRVPLTIENAETFLTKNNSIEFFNEPYWYFAQIINYGLRDSISPLSLEKDHIRSIILNKRKKRLIKKMQEEIYENAMQENDFEFF